MNPRIAAAVTAVALAAIDATETWYALTRPGSPYAEASPVPAVIGAHWGIAALVLTGAAASLLIAGAFLVRLPWPSCRRLLWAGATAALAYKAYVVAQNAWWLAHG